ncbi:MAG: SDR family oxidoreductase [Verrucomicrobiota bacterium]
MPNVFLTGASAGIGLETAKLLVREGFHVWGTSRDMARLPQWPNFHPVQLDLNQSDAIEQAWKTALQEAQRIDILINNAGNGYFGPAEMLPMKIWREQMQTLVLGPLQLIQKALPQMRAHGGGLIINISSLAARFPIPFMGAYNAAKAAMSSLTQTLRLELGHDNSIRIVDLQPGDIRTAFHQSMRVVEEIDADVYSPSIENAATVIQSNMQSAPPPEIVAQEILRIIHNPASGPVLKAGSFFQTIMAAAGARVATPAMKEHALRKFYKLDQKRLIKPASGE